jgi:CubicO group peptidase (beta-lactamase class C family)
MAALLWMAPLPTEAQESAPPAEAQVEPSTETNQRGPTDPGEFGTFIDGVMHTVLEDFHTAGAVVSVVSGGEIFFSKGYGYADWEARVPVDPATTLFRIASVSKLFVWTSVMQMVERGLLDLDTDVNEYLDFEIPDTYPEPVTLSQIMAHTAGFEDRIAGFQAHAVEDIGPLGKTLAEEFPARVRPNGDIPSYSNHATALAAYTVERASGTEWKEYVEENILEPLGMEHTTFRQPLPADLAPHMSKGYDYWGGRFVEQRFFLFRLAPPAAASASAEDMARFMIAHLQLGRLGDERILSEETAGLMQSVHHRIHPALNGMAHGFMGYDTHGERILWHGGGFGEFHTGLWLFPERQLGIFVSFNSGPAVDGARHRVLSAILDRYFPVEEVIPTVDEEFGERAARYAGDFRSTRYTHTTWLKLGGLTNTSVSATNQGTLRALDSDWVEDSPLVFREQYGSRTMVFREDEQGDITHFFISSSPASAWERIPAAETPSFQLLILLLAVSSIFLTLLAPLFGWVVRRWYKVPARDLRRIPARARLSIRLAGTLFAGFLLLLLVTGFTGAPHIEQPAMFGFTFLLPILAIVPTVASAWFAIGFWVKGKGRPAVRVFYSLAVVAFCLFIWQLNVWNLLGWNY